MDTLEEILKEPLLSITVNFRASDEDSNRFILELTEELGCSIEEVYFKHIETSIITKTPPPDSNKESYRTFYRITGDSNHLKFIRYLLTKREAARNALFMAFENEETKKEGEI